MTMLSHGGGRLVEVSPQMRLATEVVVTLARRSSGVAATTDLAATLAVSPEELREVLARLVRQGIVRQQDAPEQSVCLADGAARLSLADVADAIGDWLVVAKCDEDPGPQRPGLSRALTLVREQVYQGLELIQIDGLA